MVGVNIGPAGVAVAHFSGSENARPRMAACRFIECQGAAEHARALASIVDELALAGVATNYILSPLQYSLLLVEPPEVPEAEMKQAVRWRIKDMVEFSIDDAAVDIIKLPEDIVRGGGKMIYVVAASQEVVTQAADLVNGAGLALKYIDIAESAFCNLLHWTDTQARSVALMCLRQDKSVINLVKNDSLYLTRNISADVDTLSRQGVADTDAFNRLLLETQRSLDYYESQMGQPPATELFVLPFADQVDLSDELRANLGVNAQLLSVKDIVSGAENLPSDHLHDCVLAVAGGLRLGAA